MSALSETPGANRSIGIRGYFFTFFPMGELWIWINFIHSTRAEIHLWRKGIVTAAAVIIVIIEVWSTRPAGRLGKQTLQQQQPKKWPLRRILHAVHVDSFHENVRMSSPLCCVCFFSCCCCCPKYLEQFGKSTAVAFESKAGEINSISFRIDWLEALRPPIKAIHCTALFTLSVSCGKFAHHNINITNQKSSQNITNATASIATKPQKGAVN